MDFAELKNDTNFVEKVTNLSSALDKIEESIKKALEIKDYENLSIQAKVKYDLFLSYSINSLYWIYVKLQGLDPNNHDIRNELSRVRQAMMRDKQLYERNTIRPVLDKAAAGRFIRHGLKHKRPTENDEEESDEDEQEEAPPPKNKITKFAD